MNELNDRDGAKLVSLIYHLTMNDNWETLKDSNSKKMSDFVAIIEEYVSNLEKKLGGEMTKKEFLDVIEQVKNSDTLMRMEIKDFTNNDKTDFRAMTLIDPQNKVKPTIIFRGTAGDSQWDDNVAAIFSSQTPSQKEAASCAYFLPEGMVDRVYSYDGQGESQ